MGCRGVWAWSRGGVGGGGWCGLGGEILGEVGGERRWRRFGGGGGVFAGGVGRFSFLRAEKVAFVLIAFGGFGHGLERE